MKLTSENVNETIKYCLYNDDEEDYTDQVVGTGIFCRLGFNPKRISEKKDFIVEMLNEIPDSFKKTGGGGMSFLNLCQTNEGISWTDLHQTVDELVILGNAIGKLVFSFPRDMWGILPGGMPYVTYLDNE